MRIFVLGAGATGSLLAQLLTRKGHVVWCGDRDPERARRFLGKKSPIPVQAVNARNLWSIVKAARGCQLIVNASPAVFNQIVLRAALRLRAHYLDLGAHLTQNPFKAEQLRFHKRFVQKKRVAVINAGAAPGLTNLLVRRGADLLDAVESVQIRLFEETESDDPISQWSAEVSFDEAVSRPRVLRGGRFALAKRFDEREIFRFLPAVGKVPVYLAAQDEVGTLPHVVALREMDVKIGGNEIERLRRWHRQGKLSKSRGRSAKHFPHTLTPKLVARMIRRGTLHNARFAAAVVVRGTKKDRRIEIRADAEFPSLYQIRLRGMLSTPVAYATAHLAALFIKHLPLDKPGVFPPEALPSESRARILSALRSRSIRMSWKVIRAAATEDDDLQ